MATRPEVPVQYAPDVLGPFETGDGLVWDADLTKFVAQQIFSEDQILAIIASAVSSDSSDGDFGESAGGSEDDIQVNDGAGNFVGGRGTLDSGGNLALAGGGDFSGQITARSVLRALGPVDEDPQGYDRCDIGVQNESIRFVLENYEAGQTWEFDANNDGTMRFYPGPDTTVILRLSPDGTVQTANNTLDDGSGNATFDSVTTPSINIGAGGIIEFYDTLYFFDTDNGSYTAVLNGPLAGTPGLNLVVPAYINGYTLIGSEVFGVHGDSVFTGSIASPAISAVAATGSVVINGPPSDGQTIEINDGNGQDITFTYRNSPSAPNDFNLISPPFGSYFLADIINSSGLGITAVYDGNITINLTNNISGAAGNVDIINGLANISVTGMAGGVDASQPYEITSDGTATFAGSLTVDIVKVTSIPISVDGSVSGAATFVQATTGSSSEIVINLAALTGTASWTFDIAFTGTPSVVTDTGGLSALVTAVSDLAVTITGSGQTGFIKLFGATA